MTYEQYQKETATAFKKCGYTDAETNKFFAEDKTQKVLYKHYEGYTKRNVQAYTPTATASCLDMMY